MSGQGSGRKTNETEQVYKRSAHYKELQRLRLDLALPAARAWGRSPNGDAVE